MIFLAKCGEIHNYERERKREGQKEGERER
jgi:predicted nucleic acid-binding Zn ribbon protein